MNKHIYKISLLAVSITLAMVLSYVDSLIPISTTVPGFKLGIANIAIVFVLYKLGAKEAIIVSILRIILSSILFGTVLTLAYSIAGAILSLISMIIFKKYLKLSILSISVIGAVMHNVGQIIVAMILMEAKEIILYLPVLIVTGVISGIGVGILSAIVTKYVKDVN